MDFRFKVDDKPSLGATLLYGLQWLMICIPVVLTSTFIAPEGEIYRVAVDEAYRRRGVAYRLLDYAVKTSRGRGLESLFLEVREQNIPAKNLYKSYGFREVGIRKNYYKNPSDNAVIMLHCHSMDLIN